MSRQTTRETMSNHEIPVPAEMPHGEVILSVVPLESVVGIETLGAMSSEAEPERHLGWEYDEMYSQYISHPLNTRRVRQKRDFAGSTPTWVDAFRHEVAVTEPALDAFAARSREFPLLDGLEHEKALKERIEQGREAFLILEQNPVMDADARLKLEEVAAEGAGAYATMIEGNLFLTIAAAYKYRPTATYSRMDMVNQGYLGLRRAVQKYDPSKGFKLSTYADNWIHVHIQRGRRKGAHALSLPNRVSADMQTFLNTVTADVSNSPVLEKAETHLTQEGITDEERIAARFMLDLARGSTTSMDVEGVDELATLQRGEHSAEVLAIESRHEIGQRFENAGLSDETTLTIMALREGIVFPGLDYNQKLDVDGFADTTLGELVMGVRAHGSVISMDTIAAALGISRQSADNLYWQGRLGVLAHDSIQRLGQRLMFSEAETEEVTKYVFLKGFANRSPSNTVKQKDQDAANRIIDLLSLGGDDMGEVVDNTIAALKEQKVITSEAQEQKIGNWLRTRFIASDGKDVLERPTSVSGVKKANIGVVTALRADATFIACLAGVWGRAR